MGSRCSCSNFYFNFFSWQAFFVDDPEDDGWKVVLDKLPRSKRHSQEDDDIFRPDSLEHTFDAPGMAIPMTSGIHSRTTTRSGDPSTSSATSSGSDNRPRTVGQNVPQREINEANQRMAEDTKNSACLDNEFEDEDHNLPLDTGVETEAHSIPE